MVLRLNSHGNDVRTLQQALSYLKYPCGAVDGVFGNKVEDAVEAFQRDHDLYADGVAGPITLKVLNDLVPTALKATLQDLNVVTLAPMEPLKLMGWTKCPADPLCGGYDNTTLREDVAKAYNDLYAAVHALGGVVTSAGGKRALNAGAGPNRSRTSMHYVGRAFDMAMGSGMQNPAKDPYLLERVGNTKFWTVWCKSSLGESALTAACTAQGIRGGMVTVPATYVSGGKVLSKTATAVMFDFTALAAKFGFSRISGRKAFWDKADVEASEFWHLSYLVGLISNVSQFGTELLKVYPLAEAQKFEFWVEAKDRVFGRDWN